MCNTNNEYRLFALKNAFMAKTNIVTKYQKIEKKKQSIGIYDWKFVQMSLNVLFMMYLTFIKGSPPDWSNNNITAGSWTFRKTIFKNLCWFITKLNTPHRQPLPCQKKSWFKSKINPHLWFITEGRYTLTHGTIYRVEKYYYYFY